MSRKDAILERLAVVLAEFSDVQSSLVEAGEEELAVELQSEVVDPLQEVATDLDVLEEGEEEDLEEPEAEGEGEEEVEVEETEEAEGEGEDVTEEDLDQAQGDEDVFEIVEEAEDEEAPEEEEGEEEEVEDEDATAADMLDDGSSTKTAASNKRMKIRKKGGAPLKWLCCGKPGKIRIRKGKNRGKQAWAAWCKYRKGSKTGGMQRIVGRPKVTGKGKAAKVVLGPAPKKIMLGGRAMKMC